MQISSYSKCSLLGKEVVPHPAGKTVVLLTKRFCECKWFLWVKRM